MDCLGLSQDYYGDFPTVENMYDTLAGYLGSKQAASEYLLKCGYDGIKFSNIMQKDGKGFSYTIFDKNNVKIIDKIFENVGNKFPILYHGYTFGEEFEGKDFGAIFSTPDIEVARTYGKDVIKFILKNSLSYIDLYDGDDLLAYGTKNGFIDEEDMEDEDFVNHIYGGDVYQYDYKFQEKMIRSIDKQVIKIKDYNSSGSDEVYVIKVVSVEELLPLCQDFEYLN